MNFFEAIENTLKSKKTLTENGAIAYQTSGKALLDFNFHVSAMRNMSAEDIITEFARVYDEDPILAVKYLFYIGDVRGGLGERKAFKCGLAYLSKIRPDIVKEVMALIPEYNRWDTLIQMVDIPEVKEVALEIVHHQFMED